MLDPEADLNGMQHLRNLLACDGIMLLTIPVGVDKVYPRLHRVYGNTRLPLLLEGFGCIRREYWTKDANNRWILADENTALSFRTTPHSYALGCFVLEVTNNRL
jgi:hypothetical protein